MVIRYNPDYQPPDMEDRGHSPYAGQYRAQGYGYPPPSPGRASSASPPYPAQGSPMPDGSERGYGPPQQQWPNGFYPPGPSPPQSAGSASDYYTQRQQELYPNQPDYPNQSHGSPPQAQAPGSEEDRGLMGALAGGAAGAFAGHKVHHGFIGTMAGAYAGHKLEDAWKDHHNKPKPQSPQPQAYSPYNQPQPYYAPPPQPPKSPRPPMHTQMLGNYSLSSTRFSLDKDFDLIAECRACNGSTRMSSISLNDCLTNQDGHLRWQKGGGFGGSARNVRLVDGGKWLEAELRTCDGRWLSGRICLDERITNDDGELKML